MWVGDVVSVEVCWEEGEDMGWCEGDGPTISEDKILS